MDMAIKIIMLVVFFGSMIGIGLYCRRHSTDVNGFVLGGRSVGPWLTAFAPEFLDLLTSSQLVQFLPEAVSIVQQ